MRLIRLALARLFIMAVIAIPVVLSVFHDIWPHLVRSRAAVGASGPPASLVGPLVGSLLLLGVMWLISLLVVRRDGPARVGLATEIARGLASAAFALLCATRYMVFHYAFVARTPPLIVLLDTTSWYLLGGLGLGLLLGPDGNRGLDTIGRALPLDWLRSYRIYTVVVSLLIFVIPAITQVSSVRLRLMLPDTFLVDVPVLVILAVVNGAGYAAGLWLGALLRRLVTATEALAPYLGIMARPVGLFVLTYVVIVGWCAGVYATLDNFEPLSFAGSHGHDGFLDFVAYSMNTFQPFSAESAIRPVSVMTHILSTIETQVGYLYTLVIFGALLVYLGPFFGKLSTQSTTAHEPQSGNIAEPEAAQATRAPDRWVQRPGMSLWLPSALVQPTRTAVRIIVTTGTTPVEPNVPKTRGLIRRSLLILTSRRNGRATHQ